MTIDLDPDSIEQHILYADRRSITFDEWFTLSCRAGRIYAPRLLYAAWFVGAFADGDALREAVASAWTDAEFPEPTLGRKVWLEMFTDAGFTVDGVAADRSVEPVRLWRGAPQSMRRRMAWTTDRAIAARFAAGTILGREPGKVWTTLAPPRALLAVIHEAGRQESEYVIDTRGLRIVEDTGDEPAASLVTTL